MKIVRGNSPEWSDAELQEALASHYTPHLDESYWVGLEARILQRIRLDQGREWWSWFPGWVRLGVAAAAAAAVLASAAAWQTRVSHNRIAYRELMETPVEVPIYSERLAPVDKDREHTLRYLLTH